MTDDLSLEQLIEREGAIVTTTVGISMWPILKTHRNAVVIVKPLGKCKTGDVVLYRLKSGKCVLHRIVDIKCGRYIICGDSLANLETGITDSEIFGVLAGFYKGKKYIDCNKNKGYRIYCKVWRFTYALRFLFWKVYYLLKK